MKNIFTYCLMLSALAANARENKDRRNAGTMKHPTVQAVMEKQLARDRPAAKTTAVNKRLLAHTYRYLAPAALLDSTRAWYSGSRHTGNLAYMNPNAYEMFPGVDFSRGAYMPYDSARNFSAFTGPFALNRERFMEYTQDTLVTYYKDQYFNQPQPQFNFFYQIYRNSAGQVDSFYYNQGTMPGSLSYQHLQTMKHYYDAQGNVVVDSIYDAAADTIMTYGLHTYNSNNDQTEVIYLNWNGSSWDSSYRTTYTYSGAMMTSSVSDLYTGTAWAHNFANYMSYDANDRLISSAVHVDMIGNGTLVPLFKDSMGYTGTANSYTLYQNYMWDNGQWGLVDMNTFTLNAAGNHDTIWYYDLSNGTPEIAEKDPVIYDADGYVLRTNGYLYDPAAQTYAATPYDQNTYYYDITSNVPSMPGNEDVFAVYPNPASQFVTIKNTTKQSFVATLHNITGQQVLKQQYQPYDAVQLHINNLPAGAYMLQISGLDGAKLHSQQLIKQ